MAWSVSTYTGTGLTVDQSKLSPKVSWRHQGVQSLAAVHVTLRCLLSTCALSLRLLELGPVPPCSVETATFQREEADRAGPGYKTSGTYTHRGWQTSVSSDGGLHRDFTAARAALIQGMEDQT
ncbi:hypothetical protein ABVT39_014885 [Epinephelus coioides]